MDITLFLSSTSKRKQAPNSFVSGRSKELSGWIRRYGLVQDPNQKWNWLSSGRNGGYASAIVLWKNLLVLL